MPYPYIDLRNINTYPIKERHNLVKISDLILPDTPTQTYEHPDVQEIIEAIVNAYRNNRQVIVMMGGHVIKSGLGPLIIDLMKHGVITHLAGNGAVSIHDTELAMIGETSEDVATSIYDGTFGMAEETGYTINRALQLGAVDGLGYGESVGRYIAEKKFSYRDYSVLYNAYKLGIPFTIHVTIGADIIHQHPIVDFGVLGAASGHDFKVYCASISKLKGGVFLNFGSAVTGPEVFLKAVSVTRNLGYPVYGFTTANFDLFPLHGDYHQKLGHDNPEYYYRPRKNIVNRPTYPDGRGYHFQGDHVQTIPTIYHGVMERLAELPVKPEDVINQRKEPDLAYLYQRIEGRSPAALEAGKNMLERNPELRSAAPALFKAYLVIAQSFERGGTLFLYGNGGSMADALHISGELLKSYGIPRPLTEQERTRLLMQEDGEKLANNLERGFRVVVLGTNPSLSSAVENDFKESGLGPAQELYAMVKPGDVFLGISTSGKAKNVTYAAEAARTYGALTVLLTGESDSKLSELSDIAIHAPGKQTDRIQESHILLYHCLCEMLEKDFYG